MTNEPTEHQQRLAALKASFATKMAGRLHELEALVVSVTGNGSPDHIHETIGNINAQAHQLAGSAGTFGFPEVGQAAHQLEVFSDALVEHQSALTPEQCRDIKELLETLMSAGDA